jgi:mannose-1-phosphate guanylyltransferase
VKHFKEKPNPSTAGEFLSKGNYYWNSGMFCWSIGAILKSFSKLCPETISCVRNSLSAETASLRLQLYSEQAKVSIDIAILEKSKNVFVLPVSFTWSDVGSWLALSQLQPTDNMNNSFCSHHYTINSSGNSIFADKFVAMIGVNDLIVVDTTDSLLIINKEMSEEVKLIVEHLKDSKMSLL